MHASQKLEGKGMIAYQNKKFQLGNIDKLCYLDGEYDGDKLIVIFNSTHSTKEKSLLNSILKPKKNNNNHEILAAAIYKIHKYPENIIEIKNMWSKKNEKLGHALVIILAQKAKRKGMRGLICDQTMVSNAAMNLFSLMLSEKSLFTSITHTNSKHKMKCLNQILSLKNTLIETSQAQKNAIRHITHHKRSCHIIKAAPAEITTKAWYTKEGILRNGIIKLKDHSTGQGQGICCKNCICPYKPTAKKHSNTLTPRLKRGGH